MMQTTIEKMKQKVIIVPLEHDSAREFKIQVVGDELIIYPAHLKFYEVATPEQQALFLEEWANRKKSSTPSQIPDEALRREHLYE